DTSEARGLLIDGNVNADLPQRCRGSKATNAGSNNSNRKIVHSECLRRTEKLLIDILAAPRLFARPELFVMTNIVDVLGTKAAGRACVIRYSCHVLKVALAWGICVQPPMKVLGDERIIGKIVMLATHAIDLGRRAGTQRFGGIETPDAFQQTLAAQDLVAAGGAPSEIVC